MPKFSFVIPCYRSEKTIIALILIIGGCILMMLGLIGEYIGRIYICINDSPQYVIKEIAGSRSEL